jgi:hypothetical protein
MDMVVVYKANPESVQTVLGLLRKERFNPTTLENPSSAAVLSGAGKAIGSEKMGPGSRIGGWKNDEQTGRAISMLGGDCCCARFYFSFLWDSFGCGGITSCNRACSLCIVSKRRENKHKPKKEIRTIR